MPKDAIKDKLEGNQLDLSLNNLTAVPVKEMIALTKGTHVDLSCNILKGLPNEFCSLTHIVKLDLSKNQLESLPEEFGNLQRLQQFDLFSNSLSTLPVTFYKLQNLKWLDLRSNPLSEQLQTVAGDCLNEKQCNTCAKRVVAYMRNVHADQERKKQKQLQDEKEIKAANKMEEEKERLQKKAERLADKERRKKEFEAKRKLELEESTRETESKEKPSTSLSNGASLTEEKKEKTGLSCCGAFLTSLVGLLVVIAVAYYYCETHQKDAVCLDVKKTITPYIHAARQLVTQYTSPR